MYMDMHLLKFKKPHWYIPNLSMGWSESFCTICNVDTSWIISLYWWMWNDNREEPYLQAQNQVLGVGWVFSEPKAKGANRKIEKEMIVMGIQL
jgi:hypothetical protein